MEPNHYEFIMGQYRYLMSLLQFHYGYFSLCFSFLTGCCQICSTLCKMQAFVSIMHYELKKKSSFFQAWGAAIAVILIMHYDLKKKSSFFQAQGAVIAVVLIMQNKLKKSLFFQLGVLSELLFSLCIMISRKNLIFPSPGCCHSCCSHIAK